MEHRVIPAAGLHLRDMAQRYGISAQELFADLGAPFSALQSESFRLTDSQMIAAVVRACLLTNEPGLGFPLGLQLRLHGPSSILGAAVTLTETIRDTLRLLSQITQLYDSIIIPVLREDGERAALIFEERIDLGPAREVALIWLLTGLAQVGSDLTGCDLIERIDLVIAEPEYLPRFVHLPVTRKMHFGQAENRLCLPSRSLELRVGTISPADGERINAQCERELLTLSCANLRHRVLLLLQSSADRAPSLGEAAARLGVSPRTLKRRLAELGTSYSALSGQLSQARAEQLLLRADDPIEQIAEKLGFSDAPSFIRAFRRWTSLTPARYRALHRRPRR